MVDRKILRLTPKRFFCPLCGDWHKWEGNTLQSYNEDNPYEYDCDDVHLIFWCDEDYCINIHSSKLCDKIDSFINAEIFFEDIECDAKEHVIKFSTCIYTDEIVCSDECDCCDRCNLPSIGDKRCDDENEFKLELEFKFEFESRSFDKYAQSNNRNGIKELEENPKQKIAKKNETQTNIKEESRMANNIFNMNAAEFGPNKDENIASTLMGVAVKSGDSSWRIYDKKKKEITDVGDMQLGNLPIFIFPTTQLSEGDLIKDDGEYYFVTKVATTKTPTQTISARTGEMKNVVPIKNILGFSCYSKVIALSDSLNMDDDFDVEKLAIMSAICGQTGETSGQMNQLLPLILFKDKLGGDDDTMKLVLMSSMMTSEDDGCQMNQLLPLMLFKGKLGGDDDTMKLLLMSSMMGGNMASSNNLLISYLMLDTFMENKKGKALPKTNE